jgi:hypothetical protein
MTKPRLISCSIQKSLMHTTTTTTTRRGLIFLCAVLLHFIDSDFCCAVSFFSFRKSLSLRY